MSLTTVNQVLSANTVIWTAAAAAFLLLLLVRPVSEIWVSKRRDTAMRVMKVVLYFAIIMMIALPFLVLVTGETVSSAACGYYLLFFPLFCYYLGKRAGDDRGRADVRELIGLEMFDSMEDAQDRLYESRLRFKRHDEVVESITALASEEDGKRSGGTGVHGRKNRNTEILDVTVEEIRH